LFVVNVIVKLFSHQIGSLEASLLDSFTWLNFYSFLCQS